MERRTDLKMRGGESRKEVKKFQTKGKKKDKNEGKYKGEKVKTKEKANKVTEEGAKKEVHHLFMQWSNRRGGVLEEQMKTVWWRTT